MERGERTILVIYYNLFKTKYIMIYVMDAKQQRIIRREKLEKILAKINKIDVIFNFNLNLDIKLEEDTSNKFQVSIEALDLANF